MGIKERVIKYSFKNEKSLRQRSYQQMYRNRIERFRTNWNLAKEHEEFIIRNRDEMEKESSRFIIILSMKYQSSKNDYEKELIKETINQLQEGSFDNEGSFDSAERKYEMYLEIIDWEELYQSYTNKELE